MFSNKYLEEFRIDIVKQYLNGRSRNEICKEYGLAKSTLWGWINKYASLIKEDWLVTVEENGEYIDITQPIKEEFKTQSIIHTSSETVRLFKNGYSIICHISKLDRVLRIIQND